MCPPLSQATIERTSCLRLPTIAFSTLPMTRLESSATAETSTGAPFADLDAGAGGGGVALPREAAGGVALEFKGKRSGDG